MARVAVLGGHSILGSAWLADTPRVDVETEHGSVAVHDAGSVVMLQRHGLDEFTSAAFIDHRAHLRAVEALGCEGIIGLGSVGSLRAELGVGAIVAPDDFIALGVGVSMFTDHRGHQVPGFDVAWRQRVVKTWTDATDVPIVDGGVYWQVLGPRFETRAEIQLMAAHAHIVGMTIASECVLAKELGIPYAAVCTVDNLANGLEVEPLSIETFEAGAAENRSRLVRALDEVLAEVTR